MPYQGHEAYAQQPVSPGVREIQDGFILSPGNTYTSATISLSGASRFVLTGQRNTSGAGGRGDMTFAVWRSSPAGSYQIDTFLVAGQQSTIHEEYLVIGTSIYFTATVSASAPDGGEFNMSLQVSTL